jgi:hypothetical protein
MTVQWYLNDQPADALHGVSLSKIGKRINVLSIESVAGQHAGNYTCLAKNIAGMAAHSDTLVVNGLLSDK